MQLLRGTTLDDYTTVVAEKPNLVFDLPGDEGKVSFHGFSDVPVTLQLVSPDGVVVPLQSGNEVSIDIRYSAGWVLNALIKKGGTITYICKLQPVRIFEVVDPRPLSISRQSNVPPDIPSAIRDYLDQRLKELGIDVPVDEVLEEGPDDGDFNYEDTDGEFDNHFGEGFMEDEVPMLNDDDTPDDPAPSSEPVVPPSSSPEPTNPPAAPASALPTT